MRLHIANCQLAPKVGDFAYNSQLLLSELQSLSQTPDIALCSELFLTGYSPQDLLLRDDFMQQTSAALADLAANIQQFAPDLRVIVGAPAKIDADLYNCAYMLAKGAVKNIYQKQILPNDGVFDEQRYFKSGHQPCVLTVGSHQIGILICEDLWQNAPAAAACQAGATLLLSLNASPYHHDKFSSRQQIIAARARECAVPIIYCNQTGAVDDLIFDGNSFAVDQKGALIWRGAHCQSEITILELDANTLQNHDQNHIGSDANHRDLTGADYQALILGVQSYAHHNGFKKVLLGLSGGVDSALVLALAVDALGAANVTAIMLPSQFTSQMSLDDAAAIARNFGVDYQIIPIDPVVAALGASLTPTLGTIGEITAQNLQARARGVLLMAHANQTGALLLTTGNKSEYAVGYATLYGDMCGGFAPLKDVYKTQVFALCRWRNRHQSIIPERIISRAPSAELAANQKDQDSLPEYPVLDGILTAYIENRQSIEEIIKMGYEPTTVRDTIARLYQNEFKRQQSACGARISQQAFGRERRVVITGKTPIF